mgnify:CR=1 FL=1
MKKPGSFRAQARCTDCWEGETGFLATYLNSYADEVRLAQALKALGDASRLSIFSLLMGGTL